LALQREADALHAAREAAYAAEIAAVRDDALGDWRPTPPAPPVTTKTVEVSSLEQLNAALDSGTHYVLLPGDYTFATERAVMLRQSDVFIEARPGVVIEHTGTGDAIGIEIKGSRVVLSGLRFRGERLVGVYSVQHFAGDTCDDVMIVACGFETDQGIVLAGGQDRWETVGSTFHGRSYAAYAGFYREQANAAFHFHRNRYTTPDEPGSSHGMRLYGMDGGRVAHNVIDAPRQRSAFSARGGRNLVVEGNYFNGSIYVGPENKDKVPGITGVRFRNNTVVLPGRDPNNKVGPGFTLERGGDARITFNSIRSTAPTYFFRTDGEAFNPDFTGTIAYNRFELPAGVPLVNRQPPGLAVRDNRVLTTQPAVP
jgi:hypothetical protein